MSANLGRWPGAVRESEVAADHWSKCPFDGTHARPLSTAHDSKKLPRGEAASMSHNN